MPKPKPGTYKYKILKVLEENPQREFESYELARILSIAQNTINGYLVDLEMDSLVTRRASGYYVLWRSRKAKFTPAVLLARLWVKGAFDDMNIDLRMKTHI